MQSITIVGDFLFPVGAAAAARVRNLAIACAELGVSVQILPMAQVEPVSGYEGQGPFQLCDNVQWWLPQFSFGRWGRRPNWAPHNSLRGKAWWYMASWHSALAVLGFLRTSQIVRKGDAVLLYGRAWSRLAPVIRLCRKREAHVFLDSVEILERFNGIGGRVNPIWWDWLLGTRLLPRLVDGVTAISRPIAAWNQAQGALRTLVVPAIEHWDNLPQLPPIQRDKPFVVAYLGALTEKDDPDTMLSAMRLLAMDEVPVLLKIAGVYARTRAGNRVIAKVNADPTLRQVVILDGYLDERNREDWQLAADALVLLRLDSPAEEHSFPTRLPECLRTGLPVITSKVGDVSWHLRDGVDAAVIPPGDPVALAAVLRDLARRHDRGRELGGAGRRRGAERFDRTYHARALLEFFKLNSREDSGSFNVRSIDQRK
jgi:glycosyltransferase involved in cell wall biosynthesis